MMEEPRLPPLLRPKPHQLIPPPQKPLDGTRMLGTAPDPSTLSEISFNLMPRELLDLDSQVPSTSKSPQLLTLAPTPIKLPQMMKIAPPPVTQLGILSPPQELPSQLMLWLLHTRDILNMFNLNTETLLNSTLVLVLTTIHHTFQLTMLTQKSMMEEPRLPPPLRLKPLQLILLLQKQLDGIRMPGITLDPSILSETLPNSTLDHPLITIHHMSQLTMLTQKSSMLELKLPQLLRLKLHQLIPLLQKPSDGTSQLGTALDPSILSETLLNSTLVLV